MTAIYTLSYGICTTVVLLFVMARPSEPANCRSGELRKRDKHEAGSQRAPSVTPPLPGSGSDQAAPGRQTRHCSRPCRKMSRGSSMPMKTILLVRGSPSAHWGPRSLPISWCTPWKITLRSVPFMCSTPL